MVDASTTTVREIAIGSDDFRAECELRNAVLRVPLGLSLAAEDLSPERQQLHFGWFGPDGDLLACVIAAPLSATQARLRQMAVPREQQAQGHGRKLVQAVEATLARRGIVQWVLHARLTAVGFYAKLGYARVGPVFLEVGIPHVQMEKSVPPVSLARGGGVDLGRPRP